MNQSHSGSFQRHGFSGKGSGEVVASNQSIIQLSNVSEWPWDLSYPAVSVGGVDWGTNEGFHGFCVVEPVIIRKVYGMIHHIDGGELGGSVNLRFRMVCADGSMSSPVTPPDGSMLGNIPIEIPAGDQYYLDFSSGSISWPVSSDCFFYGYVQSVVADYLSGISCSALIEWGT